MITSISGSNDFMIDNELKNIINEFEANYGKIAIEQIDGSEADPQSILESVINLSFLSPNRLIILRRGSANKQFSEIIEQVINRIPPTNDLVIVEPEIDKRLVYYKTLKKLTDFKVYDELSDNQLVDWVSNTVKQKEGTIQSNVSKYLIELAGTNQLKLSNEISKLISYQPEITKTTIDLLVEPIPQTTIFNLLDAAFGGRSRELLEIYEDQKRQKVEPYQVIAMLTWQVHILAMIKASGKSSQSEIASKTKVSPYVINKSMNIAKKMTISQIRNLTNNLLELDIKLKNQLVDTEDALLQLLLTISN